MNSVISILIVSIVFRVYGLEQNITCPNVIAKQIDITALDGVWFVSEAATDIDIKGNCTEIIFTHENSNATSLSLRWINNNTTKQYNGTATVIPKEGGDSLNVVFADKRTIDYRVLTISYDHYALLYSCKNNDDGTTSSYELWKLSRSYKLKEKHAAEMDSLIANYNITFGMLNVYSNSEQICFKNGGVALQNNILSIIMFIILSFKFIF